ncbi:hypothetical protein FRC11_003240 [Ceratobasidium sp. 423]|nr:hypothetical protein FRC11_003240 [Ceratobasidium sp. 423]
MSHTSAGFDTRAVHVGAECDAATGAVITPIFMASTYKQDSVGQNKGYAYSRIGNPNRAQLESLLASLELGGGEAVVTASGVAAVATVVQALGQNAHIVSVDDVYGGTYVYVSRAPDLNTITHRFCIRSYLTQIANQVQGVDTTFINLDKSSDEQITASFRDNTKLIWLELPTNPSLCVIDIERIVRLARTHPSNPLVLVDNTFLSPFYLSPLLLGADIVVHSLTKYINGHSDLIMGALVFPRESTDPRVAALAKRARFLQAFAGSVPSPHDCWLAHRGAKTLHLRMQAHGRSALKVASYLQYISGPDSAVESVIYPGLSSHPRHEIADPIDLIADLEQALKAAVPGFIPKPPMS